MAIGPLINLAGSVAHSIVHHANNPTDTSTRFGQVLNSLEEVQQANPAEYRSITRQISSGLANGAKAATAGGNSVLAGQLSRLSADFTVAAASGQLPNIQDLSRAIPNSGTVSPAASIISATLSSVKASTL